jgi:hypothetical protein
MGEIIIVASDYVDYKVAGIVSAVSNGIFTISYSPADIDTSKSYNIYRWIASKMMRNASN